MNAFHRKATLRVTLRVLRDRLDSACNRLDEAQEAFDAGNVDLAESKLFGSPYYPLSTVVQEIGETIKNLRKLLES